MTEQPNVVNLVQRASQEEALADGFRATDAGNARRLVRAANGELRYVRQWGTYIIYQDGFWHVDVKDVLALEMAKRVPLGLFMFAVQPHHTREQRDTMLAYAKRCESGNALSAMIRLARAEDGILIEHTELDQQHELLNAVNGTIHLRTKELLGHDPDHLITRQIPVVYDRDALAPTWERSLVEWQPDPAVRLYLQELMGAAATGYRTEEFVIHLGRGGNGKGKFFGAIMHVLGPYTFVPHKSLIVQSRHEQHETVIAQFFGARLAVAAETSRDGKLDEEKIKELTGGDDLGGRRMREDRWNFSPTHCLHLHTNHRPYVRGTDDGIWRRIKLVQWEQSFVGREDPTLPEQLAAEAPGILNWLVEGARRWLDNGRKFTEPEAVTKATERFRDEADPFFMFLRTTADMSSSKLFATSDLLYNTYVLWWDATQRETTRRLLSKKAMGGYVKRRFTPATVDNHRGYRGLAVSGEWQRYVEQMLNHDPTCVGAVLARELEESDRKVPQTDE